MTHPEDALQRAVAKLLDHLGWRWCHVPNGGKRGKTEAARLKGLGVKPGVPDVLIFEEWTALDSRAGGCTCSGGADGACGSCWSLARRWAWRWR